jgi:hypothetical protein
MFTIPDEVVFEVLGGEAVVLNLETGIYFTLNPVGTRIWQLIEEHGDLARVRETMISEYEVGQEQLDRDLETLMGELVEKGLVVSAPAAEK